MSIVKQSKRPVCGHCGKAYGQRLTHSHQVRWPADEEMPPYKGNEILIKIGTPYKSTSRENLRQITMVTKANKQHVEEMLARAPEKAENVATITTWDGESWFGGYDPFCTLRCALDYARRMFKSVGSGKVFK